MLIVFLALGLIGALRTRRVRDVRAVTVRAGDEQTVSSAGKRMKKWTAIVTVGSGRSISARFEGNPSKQVGQVAAIYGNRRCRWICITARGTAMSSRLFPHGARIQFSRPFGDDARAPVHAFAARSPGRGVPTFVWLARPDAWDWNRLPAASTRCRTPPAKKSRSTKITI
ncbi:MAG: hypothetical protein ACLRSW_12785 [Christensenellaceae bacterium]